MEGEWYKTFVWQVWHLTTRITPDAAPMPFIVQGIIFFYSLPYSWRMVNGYVNSFTLSNQLMPKQQCHSIEEYEVTAQLLKFSLSSLLQMTRNTTSAHDKYVFT